MLVINKRPPSAQEAPEEEAQEPLPRFGVALFDESRDSGWACAPDGDPVRFRRPEDLKSNAIWVTSLSPNDFYSRWGRVHHLRNSEYISKLSYLAADLGVRMDGEGKFGEYARQASAQLVDTVHRTMVVAAQVYEWRRPSMRLRTESLVKDIQAMLLERNPPPPVKAGLRPALIGAHQAWSGPVWDRPTYDKNSINITLRSNRLTHAINVMAADIPDGAWDFFECSNKPPSLAELLDPEAPCLVQATIDFSDLDMACLSAFGAQTSNRSVLRTWLSQPELEWISQFARIQVVSVARAAAKKPLPAKLRLPDFLTADPLFALSLPVGLVAEAHWKALASDIYKPNVEGKKEITPWGVWLRATDRALSFKMALAVHQAGFHVNGYGNGSVVVRCPKEKLLDLFNFACESGFAYPSFRPIFESYGLAF